MLPVSRIGAHGRLASTFRNGDEKDVVCFREMELGVDVRVGLDLEKFALRRRRRCENFSGTSESAWNSACICWEFVDIPRSTFGDVEKHVPVIPTKA